LKIKTKILSTHTADSKPVKQEVNGTVTLPSIVFPGLSICSLHVCLTCLRSVLPAVSQFCLFCLFEVCLSASLYQCFFFQTDCFSINVFFFSLPTRLAIISFCLTCLSVHKYSVYLSILPLRKYVCLSICLSIYLPICLFVHRLHLCVNPSVCLSLNF
jgi:hypothetical protein